MKIREENNDYIVNIRGTDVATYYGINWLISDLQLALEDVFKLHTEDPNVKVEISYTYEDKP